MNKKFKVIKIICLVFILISFLLILGYFLITPYFEVPVINLVGENEITINLNSKYNDMGAVATLDEEDVSDKIDVKGEVDVKKVGDYKITYSITNSRGVKEQSVERVVKVRDFVKPTLKLKGDKTFIVNYGNKYVDPGYTAKDNYDGDLTKKVTVSGEVDTGKLGTYKRIYTVVDSSGNKITATRKIKVVDYEDPAISLVGKSYVTIKLNSSYKEPGYSAVDNYDGNISNNVYVSGKVNTKVPGVYDIYYSVSDSFGNSTSRKRTVQVGDQSDIDAANYVEISINDQKLWYYKNGKLKLSSNVVTGLKGKYDTKRGRFRVANLARGTYLVGEDYKSWVDFWILIDRSSQIGLHDASWRSSFGGNIYTYDGSHGCINMPYNKVRQLYSYLTIGTLVIVN